MKKRIIALTAVEDIEADRGVDAWVMRTSLLPGVVSAVRYKKLEQVKPDEELYIHMHGNMDNPQFKVEGKAQLMEVETDRNWMNPKEFALYLNSIPQFFIVDAA